MRVRLHDPLHQRIFTHMSNFYLKLTNDTLMSVVSTLLGSSKF